MPIVSRVLGGVVLQECGLPARMAAKMAALPGPVSRPCLKGPAGALAPHLRIFFAAAHFFAKPSQMTRDNRAAMY